MFDILTARARVGAIGTTQDTLLQVTLNTVIKLAERYCDRGLVRQKETEKFYHVTAHTLSLVRYPIVEGLTSDFVVSGPVEAPTINWVISGTPAAPAAGLIAPGPVQLPLHIGGSTMTYHVDNTIGQIIFDGRLIAHEISVTYWGGYDPLPEDLELALWMIFDLVWAMMTPQVGGGAIAAGTIESVTLSDVGTVRFATGAAAVTGGAMGGLIPFTAASVLDLYRRVLS